MSWHVDRFVFASFYHFLCFSFFTVRDSSPLVGPSSRKKICIFSMPTLHFLLLRLEDLHHCLASVLVAGAGGGRAAIRICGAVLPHPYGVQRPRHCGVCGAEWGPWDPWDLLD